MKTIEEIRDWLLENAVDVDGDLYIDGLDFSNFDGDVYISGMKVEGNLFQDSQKVQGNLYQNYQTVQGNLHQSFQEVQGNYYCSDVQVKGDIVVNEPTKLLKEITLEELAELGYKLKEIGETRSESRRVR